jgi:hypothetical protein
MLTVGIGIDCGEAKRISLWGRPDYISPASIEQRRCKYLLAMRLRSRVMLVVMLVEFLGLTLPSTGMICMTSNMRLSRLRRGERAC